MPSRRKLWRIGRLDLRCWAVLLAFRIALLIFGYRRIKPWLWQAVQTDSESIHYARQVAGTVRYAARYVPGALCLAQSLTIQYLLARSGHRVEVRVGVAPANDVSVEPFRAHAWVECDGQPLAEREDPGVFVPLMRLG